MKRAAMLFLILATLVVAGCTTVSSIYNGARPSATVKNADGTITFEFLFPTTDFDARMAGARIEDYLRSYATDHGFTTYDIPDVSMDKVRKTSGGAAAASVVAGFAGGYSGSDQPAPDPSKVYQRILTTVLFK